MGKHTKKDTKSKKRLLLIIPAIILILLIITFIFPNEVGYVLGWIVGSILSIFK